MTDIDLAYAMWRLDMWMRGYGSYRDIEWAQGVCLLSPFRIPRWPFSVIIKRLIMRFSPWRQDDAD